MPIVVPSTSTGSSTASTTASALRTFQSVEVDVGRGCCRRIRLARGVTKVMERKRDTGARMDALVRGAESDTTEQHAREEAVGA